MLYQVFSEIQRPQEYATYAAKASVPQKKHKKVFDFSTSALDVLSELYETQCGELQSLLILVSSMYNLKKSKFLKGCHHCKIFNLAIKQYQFNAVLYFIDELKLSIDYLDECSGASALHEIATHCTAPLSLNEQRLVKRIFSKSKNHKVVDADGNSILGSATRSRNYNYNFFQTLLASSRKRWQTASLLPIIVEEQPNISLLARPPAKKSNTMEQDAAAAIFEEDPSSYRSEAIASS